MKYRTMLTIFVILALFLTACGGGGDGSEVSAAASGSRSGEEGTDDAGEEAAPAEGEEAAPAEGEEAPADDGTSDGDDPFAELDDLDEGQSPLGALLGFSSDPGESEEQFVEMQRAGEEIIRTCMAEQGFEYTPIDPSVYANFDDGLGDLSEEEFVQQYGFGISTTFDEEVERFGGEDTFVDPNEERLEAMTEGERMAYQRALYGDFPEFDPTVDESEREDFTFEPGGCQGEAFEQVFTGFAIFEEFADEFEELENRIQADPRIVEITEKWRTCMSDNGFTAFETPDDMYDEIFSRMEPIYDAAFGGAFFSGGEDETDIEITGDTPPTGPQLSREARAELDELQAYEISVAVSDFECSADFADTYISVSAEYERQFIDENRDELEGFLN